MGNIEREIKLLNVDVIKMKKLLKTKKDFKFKGQYIQSIYTCDLPPVDELYVKYVKCLIKDNDTRKIKKLINEIKPCFDKKDLMDIKKLLKSDNIIDFISNSKDYNLLLDSELINIMKKVNNNFSKWIRLRKTGDTTALTIKTIVNSKGEYELDAVDELEFNVPSIECGTEFLEDLGYFFERHQDKMRIIYNYKNSEIVIDKWPMLKPYIEVEGPTKEEIDEVVSLLGYNKSDEIIINTDDLYEKIGVCVYTDEYADLSFSEKEKQEIESYLEI